MSFSKPEGTNDFLPAVTPRWQWLEASFRRQCACAGYGEIRTPIFEDTELFTRGVGDDTDIVTKQMYSFTTRGHDHITLRPEGTASVVRALIQHNLLEQGGVQKLYYYGPTFRYERVQSGRYRQFHQLGVEVFAASGPDIDAEVLAFAADFLVSIGLQDAALELNSVGCPECRPRYREALRDALSGTRTDLCNDCQRRYETNPLRILDCKVQSCRALTQEAPVLLDLLCAPCLEHFRGVLAGLQALDVAYSVNPHIVRGLDYYTRTAFEFMHGNLGAQNTVLAGGRYDGLVAELGGPNTPAIGFAAGMERLLLAVGDAAAVPEQPGPVFVATLGPAAHQHGMVLAQALRRAGVPAATDYLARSLKAQMREANRQHAWFTLILGDDELARGETTLRDMRTSEQQSLRLDTVVAHCVAQYPDIP